MIFVKNVQDIHGKEVDVEIPGPIDRTIDGAGLTLLPALIDAHVHFRQPGEGHKEDWGSAAQAAVRGGVTTVIDMPNNRPPCITLQALEEKKKMVEQQLEKVDIPLHHYFYMGAHKDHLSDLAKVKGKVVGIKVFMGSSTGGMLIEEEDVLETIFRIGAEQDLPIAVHAEDEKIIKWNRLIYADYHETNTHSKIRSREAAIIATRHAIDLARKFNTKLVILHMSTKEEMQIVREAKKEGVKIKIEVVPHHLFLTDEDYEALGTKGVMNPPLRSKEDRDALWEGINDGTVDFINTDHAPHTLEEKDLPYGKCPAGVPSIELYLPLLLNACRERMISLERIVQLTRVNSEEFLGLPPNDDWVLVDLNLEREVRDQDLKTKCQWSPYHGRVLKGWPVYTICNGNIYEQRKQPCRLS